MPGESTETVRLLQNILNNLTGFTDPSSIAIGFRTIAVDNIVLTGQTAPTNATLTSTSVNVRGASKVTVMMDVTGATTGVVISVFGGSSGFGYYQVRSVTSTAGLQAFAIGSFTTGAAAEYNGVSRIDDVFIQMQLAANTGASTGVTTTLRTRFLTER